MVQEKQHICNGCNKPLSKKHYFKHKKKIKAGIDCSIRKNKRNVNICIYQQPDIKKESGLHAVY